MKDTCDATVKPHSMILPMLRMGKFCINTRRHVGCVVNVSASVLP